MKIFEKLKQLGNSILSLGATGKKSEKQRLKDEELTHITKEEREEQKRKLEESEIVSPSKQIIKNFLANKLGVIGLVGFLAIVIFVFVGSKLFVYDPYYTQGVMKNISPGSGYMNVPKELEEEGIKKIAVTSTGAIGLSNEGKFYTWGHDPALGKSPSEEALSEQGNIKDVAAGDLFFLILTNDNKIYGWGENSFGQVNYPSEYKDLIAEEGVAKLGGGDKYSVLLTEKGTLAVWGATLPTNLNKINEKYNQQVADFVPGSTNIFLRLKDGTVALIGKKGNEIDTAMPEKLKDGSVNIVDIARGSNIAYALDDEGNNYVWGARSEGGYNLPKDMEGTVIKAVSGREHISVLTDKGYVYSWGNNNYTALEGPSDNGYVDIYSVFFNTYALKEDGLTTWGLDGFTFGSDEQGRDLLTRLVHGGSMTLLIALVSVVIQVVVGVIIGVVSGFYGGWVDNILMRFAEIISSFPFYPLIITLSSLLPVDSTQYERLIMIMIILGLLGWTSIARLVRGEILAEREKDYITAAKALGVSEFKIMSKHMIPNIISIIIVQATLGYASNLLTEAGLSFLGFGVQDPYPSWGNMLTKANESSVLASYWWRWIFPGTAVFLTALTVNLVGDALRDAMDPKAQER